MNQQKTGSTFTSEYPTPEFIAPPEGRFDQPISDKNPIIAALLAVLVGFLGIHNFYLGYKSRAIGQFVLGIIGIGSFISFPWAIVEAIMLFTGKIKEDGNGALLKR